MTKTPQTENKFSAILLGCDSLIAEHNSEGRFQYSVIGCSETLNLFRAYLQKEQDLTKWTLPVGQGHSELLIKELILKAKGLWQFPYEHAEICHCRAITTARVDQAILCGAHDLPSIRRATSANTACGTCHEDLTKIIQYRLGSSPA